MSSGCPPSRRSVHDAPVVGGASDRGRRGCRARPREADVEGVAPLLRAGLPGKALRRRWPRADHGVEAPDASAPATMASTASAVTSTKLRAPGQLGDGGLGGLRVDVGDDGRAGGEEAAAGGGPMPRAPPVTTACCPSRLSAGSWLGSGARARRAARRPTTGSPGGPPPAQVSETPAHARPASCRFPIRQTRPRRRAAAVNGHRTQPSAAWAWSSSRTDVERALVGRPQEHLGAHPFWNASRQRAAQRHQRSPGFSPGSYSGRAVDRSLPTARLKARNSSVTRAHRASRCRPRPSGSSRRGRSP